ncbi:hypothetical protein L1049_003556 [Liquidambar formosana]|uniref:Uncharacterized protein n=1 Tax=Liquidambar formosana TaxID=63359 RepID=A0AAP0N4V0_LIQFO
MKLFSLNLHSMMIDEQWHALVSSKTKESKKVYTLHLERKALVSHSGSERTWRTDGGFREPLEYEIQKSPHGSFTKVNFSATINIIGNGGLIICGISQSIPFDHDRP